MTRNEYEALIKECELDLKDIIYLSKTKEEAIERILATFKDDKNSKQVIYCTIEAVDASFYNIKKTYKPTNLRLYLKGLK